MDDEITACAHDGWNLPEARKSDVRTKAIYHDCSEGLFCGACSSLGPPGGNSGVITDVLVEVQVWGFERVVP